MDPLLLMPYGIAAIPPLIIVALLVALVWTSAIRERARWSTDPMVRHAVDQWSSRNRRPRS